MKLEPIELGSILQVAKGKKPARQSERCKDGFLPYVDIQAFEQGAVSQYTDGEKCLPCEDGDILIVCDGARSGLVGRAIKGYVGSTLALLKARGVCNSYLFHFIAGKYALLNTKMKGTGTPHLNMDVLKKQKLVVPSIEDQERIVSKIEELFSDVEHGLETLKQIKVKLAAYRQAVMKSAFDSQTNNIKKIKELCSVRVGIVIKPAQYYTDKETGIRAFRSANVKEFGVQDSDWVYLSKDGHQANKKSELKKGDILIVRSGYPGTSCVVPPEYAGSNAIDILIARPDTSKIVPEYLCLFTNSPHGKKLVTEHKRGVAQAHLNVGEYSNLCIPVPSLKEQYEICTRIGEKLRMCDTTNLAINRAILQTSALKQSILKKAFEGDLI